MTNRVSFTVPAAALRWELSGRPGQSLDAMAASLVTAGMDVESIKPGERYRVKGPRDVLEVLSDELRNADADVSLRVEMPPTDSIAMTSSIKPAPEFRRTVTIHGSGAAMSYVARAIDHGLSVSTTGVNRWTVTGRTAKLVAWLAAIYQKSEEEALAIWQWTPESVAAEDAVQHSVAITLPPVAVEVKLPDRRTTSEVLRDQSGAIVNVVQLETTVNADH